MFLLIDATNELIYFDFKNKPKGTHAHREPTVSEISKFSNNSCYVLAMG